ncbi:NAD(P)H-hydrate dehydratase [Oryzifoliimicrobium ureilyticus]|uniref:NAD(P)H-hydrate dehydratase n=1 Tax=Oryzifoliimicrobium ureilyticus TaxID=3113724 RepID=UPI0030768196
MQIPSNLMLLTPAEMTAADKAAAQSGIESYGLMERAGAAVAASALRHYPSASCFMILCGPGNNGGDGYVAARHLNDAGAEARVFYLGDPKRLHGDAARALSDWDGPLMPLSSFKAIPGTVIIDGLFGAGLSRELPEEAIAVFDRIGQTALPVLAIDLPSGVDGLTGAVKGGALRAERTITFMTRKPGHLLMPGRELCGELEVFDIGIPARILQAAKGEPIDENLPQHWEELLPTAQLETHKYRRGHLVVFSGDATKTGAARMSSLAGLKAGAGLVTIASPQDAFATNASHLTAIMLKPVQDADDLKDWLADERLKTFVLGPGFGSPEKARQFVALLANRHLVLDADGITAFKDKPEDLFALFAKGPTRLVLTPHEGEFARLFPDIASDASLGKIEKARHAASRAHSVVIYKGADTVIAAPDGRALINANAPVWLATAGSGDVLGGIIGGLLAQGIPTFEAAACGVYMHGEAGKRAGKGMTAEDLSQHILPF